MLTAVSSWAQESKASDEKSIAPVIVEGKVEGVPDGTIVELMVRYKKNDSYLGGGSALGVDEQFVEQSSIEHYVAVIADKGVSLCYVYCLAVHVAPCAGLGKQLLEEGIAEGALKLQVIFTRMHHSRHLVYVVSRHDESHHLLKLAVREQPVIDRRQFAGFIGSYTVEYSWYVHNGGVFNKVRIGFPRYR